MRMLRLKRSNLFMLTVFEYLWALFLILDGNSVWHADAIRDYSLNVYASIFSLALLVMAIIFFRRVFNLKAAVLAVTVSLLSALYAFITNSVNLNYILMFVITLPICIMLFNVYGLANNRFRPLYAVSNVMLVITLISLFLWLFLSVLNMAEPNSSINVEWGGYRIYRGYYNLLFESQMEATFFFSFYRNTSIFTEAPMFNLWLCISLMTEVFFRAKPRQFPVIIYILGILTSISTTGIIGLAIGCGMILLRQFGKLKKNLLHVFALFVGIAVVVIALQILLNLWQQKALTNSYSVRMLDIRNGWNIFLGNPMFGIGILRGDAITTAMGYSNSFFMILATGGLFIGLISFLPVIVGIIRCACNKDFNGFAFNLLYIYLVVTTIFCARILFVVLTGFFISRNIKEKETIRQVHKVSRMTGGALWFP